MTRGSFLLGFVATLLLTGRGRAQVDDMAQVERAARRFAELRSYSFRMSYEVTGLPLMRQPYLLNGKWERGVAHLSSEGGGGPVEFYVTNDRAVFRRPGGQWQTGSADDPAGGERRGISSIGLPGEDLDKVHTKVKSMRRSARSEVVDSRVCVTYAGDLTAQGERAIIEGLAFPVDTSEANGTARIWIDPDGIIRKYTLAGTPKVVLLGLTFALRATKTAEIGGVDAVEVKPPAAVMRLLEGAR
jgi:hypothetical protein